MSEAATLEKPAEDPHVRAVRLANEVKKGELQLMRDKLRANVRVFEKMNLTDSRRYGNLNPLGASAYLCGMDAAEAAAFLQRRTEEGKKKYGGANAEAKLLYSRTWQPGDGWIYSEAYYEATDSNLTLRLILLPDGTCLAY